MSNATPIPGQHGGTRAGAGRPEGFSPSADSSNQHAMLLRAKVKREFYKAQMAEVEYRLKTNELYERGEVLRVIRTAIAIFAEQMRSLPDKLERSVGLTPSQAEMAETEVDNQLEELKGKLAKAIIDAE
jgi:hypothetical protein